MKEQKISVKVVPDARRVKNDKRFPLKLRVTYKGIRKYYATTFDVTEEEWQSVNSAEAKGRLRKIKTEIAVIESLAQKSCENLKPFLFSQFEYNFYNGKAQLQSVEAGYDQYIEQLKVNKQYGSADSFKTALSSLRKYKRNLQFEHITKEFLEGFENWMLMNGKSITTVGIYVRTLRAVMNVAKEKELIDQKGYPFGRRKYVIPTGMNVKKALDIEQVKQIFEYQTTQEGMERAKDFWIFSYLCNGMNMMDVGQLKQRDLHSAYITFRREKTKRSTRGNPVIITVLRNNYIDEIIKKWGTKSVDPDDYIFGIANRTDSFEMVRKKIKQFTDVTNDWTKKIGKDLGFKLNLTSYVARHSFATILVRSGAPLKLASQTLGHHSITTTEKYFAGFDLDAQAKYVKALTKFSDANVER
jgi:integrase/recombinase XerD